MSGIAGVLQFNPEIDVTPLVIQMSGLIQHRGNESLHQFQNPDKSNREFSISLRSHRKESVILDSDSLHFSIISTTIGKPKEENYQDLFNSLVLKIGPEGFQVYRSIDGSSGFYYAPHTEYLLFASERKCIWALGVHRIETLRPGTSLSVTWNGERHLTDFFDFKKIERKRLQNGKKTILDLKRSLATSFSHLRDIQKCAVLFSGGVDSSLAAALTMKECSDTILVTVACKGAFDKNASIKAAESLVGEHILIEIDEDTIWDILPELIYSIETSDRMQVEIALPFFVAATEAKKLGYDTMISGQGPDELFAGYARYERLLDEKGKKIVEDALLEDVMLSHETNIQRDVRAISSRGMDVFFPYLYPPFLKVAIQIPLELKLDKRHDPSRKLIFRELARSYGLDESIVLAPKRATQYSSGTSRLLTKLIKQKIGNNQMNTMRGGIPIVQQVLDKIAWELGIPIQRSIADVEIDLKPTRRLQEKLGVSTTSNKW